MNTIRTLTAREIECRISQVKEDGLQLLLYKDARCDMAILDETFGAMNWKRAHSRENANCTVSIWDDAKKEWVSKEDTGTESNTEAEKGLASDSFKRACVNWGIGRELYTAPYVWITNCNIKEYNGKFKCFDRFEVSEIGYNDHREINRLVVINSKTKAVVYSFGEARAEAKAEAKKQPKIGDAEIQDILTFCTQNDINSDDVCKLYNVSGLEQVTLTQYANMQAHWTDIYNVIKGVA